MDYLSKVSLELLSGLTGFGANDQHHSDVSHSCGASSRDGCIDGGAHTDGDGRTDGSHTAPHDCSRPRLVGERQFDAFENDDE